jgi:hypothetical protein
MTAPGAPSLRPSAPHRAHRTAWLSQKPRGTTTFPFGRSNQLFCLVQARRPARGPAFCVSHPSRGVCRSRSMRRLPTRGARAWRQRFASQLRDYRATGRAGRRRALLLRRRRGSRLGGIPSFSAAVSETKSSAVSVESAATARRGVAIRLLGQPDHVGGRGWGLAARHWPQFRQIVVPIAGSVVGHRIEGMLPRPSAVQATCSVSLAQPEQ